MFRSPAALNFSIIACTVLSMFTLMTLATGNPVSGYLSLASFPFMAIMFANSTWRRMGMSFSIFSLVYNFLVHYGQIRQLDAVGVALLAWFGLCIYVAIKVFRTAPAQQTAAY